KLGAECLALDGVLHHVAPLGTHDRLELPARVVADASEGELLPRATELDVGGEDAARVREVCTYVPDGCGPQAPASCAPPEDHDREQDDDGRGDDGSGAEACQHRQGRKSKRRATARAT